MSDQPYIRLATPDDAAALQALLTRLLDAHVMPEQDAAGVAKLTIFASFDRIVARMQAGLHHHSDLARITVNASGFAVPVYERLGFVRLGESVVRNDVRATPMEFRRR